MIDPRVSTLCSEYGITIVDGRAYPGIRETRAVTTMERILNSKGEDHFRMVLITLAETENNAAYLDKFLWWACSDLVETYHHLVEGHTSEWLKAFDAAPVGELQYIARPLKHQRYALVGMLAERIAIAFGPRATQPDLFSDRRAA
jgi:hypothetical protein